MPVPGPDVLVVGAGVSGLTTAVCLAEAGRGVEIRADRLPPDTTSAVAGALWGPHLVETGERAVRWCGRRGRRHRRDRWRERASTDDGRQRRHDRAVSTELELRRGLLGAARAASRGSLDCTRGAAARRCAVARTTASVSAPFSPELPQLRHKI